MNLRWHVIPIVLAIAAVHLPAIAATRTCGAPQAADDGWRTEPDPHRAGFDADLLCDAVQTFAQGSSNRHSLLVERHGMLVVDAYRTGSDRSTYSLWASKTAFDRETLHDVRSITKSVVAMLWGIAEGTRAAPPGDTPILDLLPELADLRGSGRERITVEHMLCMRSGLDWDESGGYSRWGNDERGLLWRADRARYVMEKPLAHSPGTQFNYNGGLTAILGIALEARTGANLQDYARHVLLEPLGIREWEWVTDLRGHARAYTGLRLRPRDLARLGRVMLDGGRWQNRQVVPEVWVRTLLARCSDKEEFGHHWWSGNVFVRGKEVTWHGALGNGGQRLFVVPSLDMVVVMTAGAYNDANIGRAQLHLLQQVVAATMEHAGKLADGAVSSTAASESVAVPLVETRATLQSIAMEDGGVRTYVHLKLVPQAKRPFTTARFRVRDASLLTGLQKGTSVKFRAERMEGENALTSIRAVAPCVRFQPCD
ncbi:MAG: serine hydrolase [Acidovorax sp.]|nr:MAG: serine hydrolase [Acidovorax sp.]